MAKASAKKPPTKSEIYKTIADKTDLSRKQVAAVFDELTGLLASNLKKGGLFVMPGLMKITVIRKPATKDRPGINPFTKEPTIIKAKPARNVVKVRPMKALKSMV